MARGDTQEWHGQDRAQRWSRIGADGAEAGGPPASLQTFRERLPRAGLERYVTCVWIQQVVSDSGPYTHRTVPNGFPSASFAAVVRRRPPCRRQQPADADSRPARARGRLPADDHPARPRRRQALPARRRSREAATTRRQPGDDHGRNSRHVPDGRKLTEVDATQPAGGAAAGDRHRLTLDLVPVRVAQSSPVGLRVRRTWQFLRRARSPRFAVAPRRPCTGSTWAAAMQLGQRLLGPTGSVGCPPGRRAAR